MAALLLPGVASFAQSPPPIQYGYDELGRLVVVVDQNGDGAVYTYDPVGNLVSIERIDASQLPGAVAISYFTPQAAKAGATVSIFGKGFSATATDDTVSFNGGAATITTASPNRLIVTVPTTAMTGPISVTSPLGSAVSATNFRLIGPLTVSPSDTSLSAGGTMQFTPTGPGGYTPPVGWAVNGVAGGNAAVGTISSDGLYTAPGYLPQPILVTITASDQNDPTTMGSATATVFPTGATLFSAANQVSAIFPQRLAVLNGVDTIISASAPQSSSATDIAPSVTATFQPQSSATTTALQVSATFEPFISGVSPTTIARGTANATVTLTGWGFDGASGVVALLGQTADSNVTASVSSVSPDGTQATLLVSVTSGATTGARVLQIVTPNGTSTAVNTTVDVLTVQ